MNKKIIFAILLVCIGYLCFGQNLVANGNFENYNYCPKAQKSTKNELEIAYWEKCGGASPDYFNSCCRSRLASVPYNSRGYQLAHEGAEGILV